MSLLSRGQALSTLLCGACIFLLHFSVQAAHNSLCPRLSDAWDREDIMLNSRKRQLFLCVSAWRYSHETSESQAAACRQIALLPLTARGLVVTEPWMDIYTAHFPIPTSLPWVFRGARGENQALTRWEIIGWIRQPRLEICKWKSHFMWLWRDLVICGRMDLGSAFTRTVLVVPQCGSITICLAVGRLCSLCSAGRYTSVHALVWAHKHPAAPQ